MKFVSFIDKNKDTWGIVKDEYLVGVDEAMLQAFRSQLESRSVSVDEELFTMDLEFIKAMIRYQIDIALFSVEEARRNLTSSDPQAQFALTLFPEAERLLRASQRGSAVAADQD